MYGYKYDENFPHNHLGLEKWEYDPTLVGHGRNKGKTTPSGVERCDNDTCGWTAEYPPAPGASNDTGNSYYHYHHMKGLR